MVRKDRSQLHDFSWQNELIAGRLPPQIESATNLPTQQDITHAILSDVVYNTLPVEGSSEKFSWERVNARLQDVDVRKHIGDGWQVVRRGNGSYMSSLDSIVVENRFLGDVIQVSRGTSLLVRDLLINDIGGYTGIVGRRVPTTLDQAREAQQYAQSKNYHFSLTGHSLGGSVASAVGAVLDVYVYTFNSPELRHSLSGEFRAGPVDASKIRHFRLQGDVVSFLGGTVFADRDGATMTLPTLKSLNPADAHRIVNLSPMLTKDHLEGTSMPLRNDHENPTVVARVPFRVTVQSTTLAQVGFDGGVSWSSTQRATQHIGHIDLMSTPAGVSAAATASELSRAAIRDNIHGSQIDRADLTIDSILTVTETKRGNLFFTAVKTEEVVQDAQTKALIDQHTQTRIDPSIHTSAALQSGRISLVNQLADALVSTGGTSLRLSTVAQRTGEVMGRSFATSALSSQLNQRMGSLLVPMSSIGSDLGFKDINVGATITSGGVDAAFQIIHGDKAAAARSGLEALASSAIQMATGLPIRYNRSQAVYAGKLFGSNVMYSHQQSDELGLSVPLPGGLNELFGGASVGIAHSKMTDVFQLRNGQIVHRVSHGMGGFAKAGPASIAAGFYSGVESFESITVTYQDHTTGLSMQRTEWGDRTFKGQLTLRVGAGDRLAVLDLLPALSAVKNTYWFEAPANGEPIKIFVLENTSNAALAAQQVREQSYATMEDVRARLAAGASGGGGASLPNLPVRDASNDAADRSSGAINPGTSATPTPGVNTGAPSGWAGSFASDVTGPTLQPEFSGGAMHIRSDSALLECRRAASHHLLHDNQGRKDIVTSRSGTTQQKTTAMGFRSDKSASYQSGLLEATTATQSTTVDGAGLVTIATDQHTDQQYYTDLKSQTESKRFCGLKYKNKTRNFADGERRTLGEHHDLDSSVRSEFKADGSAMSTREYVDADGNAASDAVREKYYEANSRDHKLVNGIQEDLGTVSTTHDRGATEAVSADGITKTARHQVDVTHDSFVDVRQETKDGVTTNYDAGAKRTVKHIGDETFVQELDTPVDGPNLSSDHKCGKQDRNGVVGDAKMDVSALERNIHDSTTAATAAKEASSAHEMKETAHGSFIIAKEPPPVAYVGSNDAAPLTIGDVAVNATCQESQYVQGYASSTTREIDTATGLDATYDVGAKDLVLKPTQLVRVSVNTFKPIDKNAVLYSEPVPPSGAAGTAGHAVTDQFRQRREVAVERFDISGGKNSEQPSAYDSVNLNDVSRLPVEKGGLLTEVPDMSKSDGSGAPTSDIPCTIKRTQYDDGVRVDTKSESSTGTRWGGLLVDRTRVTESTLSNVTKESEILSGHGGNAQVGEGTKTVGDAYRKVVETQQKTSGVLWHTTTRTTQETDLATGVAAEPTVATDHAPTGLNTRSVGAGAGFVANTLLMLAVGDKLPDGHCAMGLTSVAEAGAMGLGMDMIRDAVLPGVGAGIVLVTTVVAAVVRSEVGDSTKQLLDGTVVQKDRVDKTIDIAASVGLSGLQLALNTEIALSALAPLGDAALGGALMAAPLVIDIIKNGVEWGLGRKSTEEALVELGSKLSSIALGGAASYVGGLGLALIAPAGYWGVLTLAAGGAAFFAAGAFLANKLWSMYRAKRRAEEIKKKKLERIAQLEQVFHIPEGTAEEKFGSLKRRILFKLHNDRNQTDDPEEYAKIKDAFQKVSEELEELVVLKVDVGQWVREEEDQSGDKALSWSSYVYSVAKHVRAELDKSSDGAHVLGVYKMMLDYLGVVPFQQHAAAVKLSKVKTE